MDLYLSAQDSLSLQEMLDCDYKTDLESVLAGTDLSLSLNGEFPPIDLDDAFGGSDDMTMWFTNGCLHNGNSNSSSNFNLDLLGGDAAALMVNPSSVMPVTLVTIPPTSPESKNIIVSSASLSPVQEVVVTSSSPPNSSSGSIVSYTKTSTSSTADLDSSKLQTAPTLKIATYSNAPTSGSGGIKTSLNSTKTVPNILGSTKISQTKQVAQIQINNPNTKTIQIHSSQNNVKKQHSLTVSKTSSDLDYDERPYPKPAYSYSCLIAMALKNSKTGSLPVSEIYNFMCEHFPYFKTAPNGWKNSVRHNLSLNKCFEKIDKPTGNGNQQRKGCLWAMNPAKIAKMDEEVQKWSKKDPMAIKKAMICPENLELLEKGEMKRDFSGLSGVSCAGGSEESDEEVGSAPCTPVSPSMLPEFIDINNMVVPSDSFDESSLDFDIEVAEGIYEELEAEDEKVNIGITIAPEEMEIIPAKKSKGTVQGNYIYRQVSTGGSQRRKGPLLLRTSHSTLVKLENP